MDKDLHCKKCPRNARCEGRRVQPRANEYHWFLQESNLVIECRPQRACMADNKCSRGEKKQMVNFVQI